MNDSDYRLSAKQPIIGRYRLSADTDYRCIPISESTSVGASVSRTFCSCTWRFAKLDCTETGTEASLERTTPVRPVPNDDVSEYRDICWGTDGCCQPGI